MQFWDECYDEKGNIISDLAWNQVRRLRSELLAKCDWTDLPHAPLTETEKTAWMVYRQALRDITKQKIEKINWPEEP